jgi:N-acetylglucosamine-6-sulfatase
MDASSQRAWRARLALMMILGAAVVTSCVATFIFIGWKIPAASARTTPARPNIVFVIADDMRYDDLKYMLKTRSVLKKKGMSFKNAFVSNALCCPSRAAIMRGQYAHNSGVWTNEGPDGGWQGYKSNGLEQDNVATRLDGAGYRTGLFGKYLNNYEGSAVPVGWDDWFGGVMGGAEYFNYDVNDNGTIRHFGTADKHYLTDVLRRQTQSFIDASVVAGKPFFAYVAPTAPHPPATPAPRDRHTYDGAKAPRLPSFNERDVSDKPPWIRHLPGLGNRGKARIDSRHERRVESLQALDDLVAAVIDKLKDKGVLSNTYIFFTSDNGWHNGEHRIPFGKARPYEEDIRVPLVVRGPGVGAGSTTSKLTLNTDFFPTFTALAGLSTPDYVDGRSLRPVLKRRATAWRSAILLEAATTAEGRWTPSSYGIRTSTGKKYVEYEGGARELYYLGVDPHEISNKYDAAGAPTTLASRLTALKGCAAERCRAAENGQ